MELVQSLRGVDDFLVYFAVALVAEGLFLALYMAVTPHHEVTLIKAGNTAAAVALAGAVLGFTLPLASAIAHNVSLLGTATWAGVALVVQLAVFLGANFFLRGLTRQIEEGNLAAGVTVAAASIAVGTLSAVCMVG